MLLYSELLRASPLIKTILTNQTRKRPEGRFFVFRQLSIIPTLGLDRLAEGGLKAILMRLYPGYFYWF